MENIKTFEKFMDVPTDTLSELLQDEAEKPTSFTIGHICQALGIYEEWLVKRAKVDAKLNQIIEFVKLNCFQNAMSLSNGLSQKEALRFAEINIPGFNQECEKNFTEASLKEK